jgi:hypothetical protein
MMNPNQATKEAGTSNSPLGIHSSAYRVKTSEKGSILDNPDLGLLEFYPAGYTKPDKDGQSRQEVYQAMYEDAVTRSKEEQLYPLGKDSHDIILVPDFENPYDKNAMAVRLVVFNDSDPLYKYNGADIGFVPMKISAVLAPNRGMIKQGRILKVRNAVHAKYYSAKVVLSYGNQKFSSLDLTSNIRFTAIMEE